MLMWTSDEKIKLDDLYISVLKRKKIRRADGWERMEDVSKKIKPTPCIIVDTVVYLMAIDHIFDDILISSRLNLSVKELSTVLRIFTGYCAVKFINLYRLKMAAEYLTCTDVPLETIMKRTGWASLPAFSTAFHKRYGIPPRDYRIQNREYSYRLLYEWE